MLHNERSKHSILVALFSIFLNFKAAKIELFCQSFDCNWLLKVHPCCEFSITDWPDRS